MVKLPPAKRVKLIAESKAKEEAKETDEETDEETGESDDDDYETDSDGLCTYRCTQVSF